MLLLRAALLVLSGGWVLPRSRDSVYDCRFVAKQIARFPKREEIAQRGGMGGTKPDPGSYESVRSVYSSESEGRGAALNVAV